MSRKIVGVTVGTSMNPKKIAEQINTGTSLPMVNEEDEGKILQVKDGKWTAHEDDDSYDDLDNLPSINGVSVKGDMTSEELNLQEAMSEFTTAEIIEIWNKYMND